MVLAGGRCVAAGSVKGSVGNGGVLWWCWGEVAIVMHGCEAGEHFTLMLLFNSPGHCPMRVLVRR